MTTLNNVSSSDTQVPTILRVPSPAAKAVRKALLSTARPLSLAIIDVLDPRDRAFLGAKWVRGEVSLRRSGANAAKIFKVSRTLVVEAKNGSGRVPSADPLGKAWERAGAEQRAAFLQNHVDAVWAVLDDATAPTIVHMTAAE